jgi:hypothetical protein
VLGQRTLHLLALNHPKVLLAVIREDRGDRAMQGYDPLVRVDEGDLKQTRDTLANAGLASARRPDQNQRGALSHGR